MEPGAGSGGSRKDVAGPETNVASVASVTIADAHHGFFHDLNTIHHGMLERLNEAYKKHARPFTEVKTQADIQSLNEEYFKAVQDVYCGQDVAQQITAAFNKYKAAATRALDSTAGPAEMALLSQSMYIVAMYAGQLPFLKSTP